MSSKRTLGCCLLLLLSSGQLLGDARYKYGRLPTKTAGSLYDLYAPDKEQKHLRFRNIRITEVNRLSEPDNGNPKK